MSLQRYDTYQALPLFDPHSSFSRIVQFFLVELLRLATMTAAASAPSPTTPPRIHHCIQCLTETSTLYRKFSPTSLKLTVCEKCGFDVDPYIEREAFLVVMDWILLRQDAYRHLLLNRIEHFDVSVNQWQTMQYVIASGILQTHLAWEAHRGNLRDNSEEESLRNLWNRQDAGAISLVLHMFLQAVVRIFIFWAVTYVCLRQCSKKTLTSSPLLLTRTYLAVLLPTLFAVVTVLVLVWENTDTVRFLGSILILTYQAFSIHTVGSVEGVGFGVSFGTTLLAITLCVFTSWIFTNLAGLSHVPCAGFYYNFNAHLSLCVT